ncbi:MAG: tRNA CCA-pyrophosphorylase [Peptococcaceae bacterium]|nr:tRNA CCA-pyrophosphorylase [Peptococcaceae bacterium]
MNSIEGLLITVRTGRQGAAMEKGKFSAEYIKEISTLVINPEDFSSLGLGSEKKAILKSHSAEITVTCQSVEGPKGIFFLPLGPLANMVIDGETNGTGVPNYKGIPVSVTAVK